MFQEFLCKPEPSLVKSCLSSGDGAGSSSSGTGIHVHSNNVKRLISVYFFLFFSLEKNYFPHLIGVVSQLLCTYIMSSISRLINFTSIFRNYNLVNSPGLHYNICLFQGLLSNITESSSSKVSISQTGSYSGSENGEVRSLVHPHNVNYSKFSSTHNSLTVIALPFEAIGRYISGSCT